MDAPVTTSIAALAADADGNVPSVPATTRSTAIQLVLLIAALLGSYWVSTRFPYVLFHTLAELFSVIIAGCIFAVTWNSRRFQTNNYLALLGIAFLSVGFLDIAHLLTYQGMNVVPGGDGSADRPTQLWVAGRAVIAFSLLIAPLLAGRRVRMGFVLVAYLLITIWLLGSVFWWHGFPRCYVAPQGMTPFKRAAELTASSLILASGVLLWTRRRYIDRHVLWLLLAAMVTAAAAGAPFTIYRDVTGTWNWAGHCLKVLSYFLVYKAVFVTGFERPYALMFRDLKQNESALRSAKLAAEAASEAKDQFLAVLSHELRTPLTPVLTTVQLMEADADLPLGMRDDLVTIRRNIELESRLIDDLLDLTRISRGKLELHFSSIDAHDKLRHVLRICDSDVRARRLSLAVDLTATRNWLQADPARLQQIIWNLLKNAIKFTPPGGSIRVRTRDGDDECLVIQVQDTGIGIETPRLGRIFDAFEQGGRDVTRLFGGLGLGLTITKALVELHGGQIRADSDGRGCGATFTVQLPGASVTAPRPSPGTAAPGVLSAAGSTCRILLVEDHLDTARALARLLGRSGHTVRVADSVAAALRAASADHFDLVISDIGLPDGSGCDLMRQLLARSPIKGIALSGFGMEEDINRSKAAGFQAHLTKPVNFYQLAEIVNRLAAQPHADAVPAP